jgi:uncharacterized protein YjdB
LGSLFLIIQFMKNKLLLSFVSFLFLTLSTGTVFGEVRSITNTDGGSTEPGSFLYELYQIQDGDSLVFDSSLANETIIMDEYVDLAGYIPGGYTITIIGNSVTLTQSYSFWAPTFYMGLYDPFKRINIENVHFKDMGDLALESETIHLTNCVFTLSDESTQQTYIGIHTGNILFEGCAFIAENMTNTLTVQSWGFYSPPEKVSFVSCTFVRKYAGDEPLLQLPNPSAFTNCVFVDPYNTGINYTISIPADYLVFNGYNVIHGTINGSWTRTDNNHATDRIVAQDAADDASLYYQDDIYKVVVANGNGPAYKILPANPSEIVEGVSFPRYDLEGTEIDYTKESHAGAWQALYGEEPADAVYPTEISIRGIDEGKEVFCKDTTFKLTATVLPYACDQAVTWESSQPDIAAIDEDGQVSIPDYGDPLENDEVIFTATTVALKKDGQPLTASVSIKVKPYIRVTGIRLSDRLEVRAFRGTSVVLPGYHNPVITPANATNQNIIWSIEEGSGVAELTPIDATRWRFTGKTAGTAILMATTEDGGFTATATYTFYESTYTNTKGAFQLTEGTYPAKGCLNFLNEEVGLWNNFIYGGNSDRQFGVTTQFAAIYGDHFYFVSKQEDRLAIIDKNTLDHRKSFSYIHDSNSRMMDGRAFVGVDENTGYVGTSGGIAVVKFDELLGATANANNVVQELPHTQIGGLEPTGEGLYTGQIGTMLRAGDRVFAIQQNAGIHVINALTHQLETTLRGNYSVLTQSKDGSLWAGCTLNESTGGLDEASRDALIRIDPWSLETEELVLPAGTAPTSSWGAWQADLLCASAQNNRIYWAAGNSQFLKRYIYEYDIDTKTTRIVFDAHAYPTVEGYPDEKWNMYGCPFRIHPETDELYVVITTWHINPVVGGWIAVKVNPETKEVTDLPSGGSLTWNALWIFQDNYAPVISTGLSNTISLKSETRIYLGDKVTDADNLDAAIVKSAILKEGEDLITARIWRDSLIVTPIKRVVEDTQTTLTLKVNSNGKVITKSITVTVEGEGAITEYPFELTAGKVTIKPGDQYQLALTAAEHYPNVRWSSSHPEVATVSSNGLVRGLSHGIANIIVKDANSAKADTCMVTVIAPGAATKDSIALNTTQLIMNVKETASLSITLVSGSLAGKTVKWTTSDAGVADITSSGKVIATGMGAATITASIDEVKAICTVMVRDISVNAEASSIEDRAATITFPKMASAAYYLAHVYEMVNSRRQALISLKINAEGEVDIAYALRAATNAISVTLSTLKPATEYEVDVEVVRIQNDIAEVISTLTTNFRTKANATSVYPAAIALAVVSYTNGTLYVQNLEGYRCQVIAINGQSVKVFTVNNPDESRMLALPQGVYILSAEKNGNRKIFKLIVR